MYGKTERCDEIDSAGHKALFHLVTFVKMSLFERGYKNGNSGMAIGCYWHTDPPWSPFQRSLKHGNETVT